MMTDFDFFDRQFRHCLADHQIARFAACTIDFELRDLIGKSFVRMVRTKIDTVQDAAIFGKLGLQATKNMMQAGFVEQAFGDLRPVGDGNRQEAGLAGEPHRLAGSGDQLHLVGMYNAMAADIFVEYAIAIENTAGLLTDRCTACTRSCRRSSSAAAWRFGEPVSLMYSGVS